MSFSASLRPIEAGEDVPSPYDTVMESEPSTTCRAVRIVPVALTMTPAPLPSLPPPASPPRVVMRTRDGWIAA